MNFKMAIIGFSLSEHDEYARQTIYRIARNYQEINWNKNPYGKVKRPIVLVDKRSCKMQRDDLLQRYAFIDQDKALLHFDGFDETVLDHIFQG